MLFRLTYLIIIISPFIAITFLLQARQLIFLNNFVLRRIINLCISNFIFLCSIFLFILYLNRTDQNLLQLFRGQSSKFGLEFIFFFDFLNINLLMLTGFIFCLVIYYTNKTTSLQYDYCLILLYSLWGFLNILFCIGDLFLFYCFFELSLLPIFFLIGVWGNRMRKIHAAAFFFFYTSIFSFLLLFGLLNLFYWLGTFSYQVIKYQFFAYYYRIHLASFQLFWCLALITFFAKLPIFPFHIWLPEAHVEAPTIGSVILASILLKIGAYAIFRFLIPFYDSLSDTFGAFTGLTFRLKYLSYSIRALLWCSLVYCSIIILTQVDFKKIIAYSSVIHMSLCMLGIMSGSVYGIYGSYIMIFAHAFSSAGLFFIAGMLYSRFGTRLLKYYSGIQTISPRLSSFCFFFSLANIGFPGTINFISEFCIFIGILHFWNLFFIGLFGFCFIVNVLYSIWVYNKIFLGTFSTSTFIYYYDLRSFEQNILIVLLCPTLFFGLFPTFIF